MLNRRMDSWIGRSIKRREDPALLTGRGRYAADPDPAGLAHIAVRRAGVPRGSGLAVNVDPALGMPGVLGAWTAGGLQLADDYMPDAGPQAPAVRRPVLAFGDVRFEGDAVAVVAAENPYQAADAADAIDVKLDAGGAGGDSLPRQELGYGDLDAAFDSAPVVVRERMSMSRICGAAMEPRAVLAEWREEEQRLYLRASIGWVHGLRDQVAAGLGLDRSQVVALAEDVGGSFGAKNMPYPEYVMAAAISRLLRRPVKWVASRSEDGHTTGQAHSVDLELELAAESDGRLRGLRARLDWGIGAYASVGGIQERSMAAHMLSTYRLPALGVAVVKRASPAPPAAFIRGGGRPVGNFAIERMVDRLARRLGLDPIEVRRRNLVPAAAMPYETGFPGVTYDGGDFERLLNLVAERVEPSAIRERQRRGEPVGLGLAMCAESTGMGLPETSRVVVLPDGTARIFVGTTPQGQGHRTFAAQVAAERLGWPYERVEIRAGDSREVPFSMVTAGSRSALEVGNSVALSATAARRQLLDRASERLEAAIEDIVLDPGGAGVRGVPERRIPLPDLVGEGLEAVGTWDSKRATAWASSCHAAIVRIDPETGGTEMLRYVIAHDSGRAINPLLLEGQLHGGYAHGLGYALFEEANHSPEGVFLSPSFLDYTVVSAPELQCEPELIHTESASTQNPEGFRGAGEAGTIAVPAAIANAVEDALHATGHTVTVNAIPITPQRLWTLLK
jgi:aerobic carbon-monoxide dehydrogenase large subunit